MLEWIDWSNPIADVPMTRGLVTLLATGEGPYWGGPKFYDLVPKSNGRGGYHGTLTNGPVWGGALGCPGQRGSLDFDGVNDHVLISSFPAYTSNVSVFLVFRMTTSGTQDLLLSHDSGANDGWRIAAFGGTTVFTLGGVGSSQIAGVDPGTSQWMALVATWTGNGGTATGYMKNLQTGARYSSANATGTLTGTPSRITLSSPLFGDGFHFTGRIAEFALWNRLLSAGEAWGMISDSEKGHPELFNRISLPTFVEQAAAPGGTTSPWYYYRQMQAMAG